MQKKLERHPEWLEAFDRLLEGSTAGLPQDEGVKWTHLDRGQIVDLLAGEGLKVSRYHVAQMLRVRGYKKRKLLKMNDMKQVEQRNEQFEKIGCYRSVFTDQNLPVLSVDTKKKEMLGNFHRGGQCYSTATRRVNDHDFSSFSEGRVVPHGIYDVNANKGYMTLGTSSDTSEFVCDNLRRVWVEHLQFDYPQADTVLLLCDGGGSNASAHYIVKQDLVKLAKSLGISILVAHYPPYCSKYNGSGQPSDRTPPVRSGLPHLAGGAFPYYPTCQRTHRHDRHKDGADGVDDHKRQDLRHQEAA